MAKAMDALAMRDKNILPTEEVLQKTLGKRCHAVYKELIDIVTDEDYGLNLEWRFYNDGKTWLGKVTYKKKTIFWLSIYDGFFKIGFHFTEKTRGGVLELNIDEEIKTTFAETKTVGKLVSLTIKIDRKSQIKAVLEIVKYKMMLK